MGATWQSYASAFRALDKRLLQFDSIAQMASIERRYVYDRRGSPREPEERLIGMVLLQIEIYDY